MSQDSSLQKSDSGNFFQERHKKEEDKLTEQYRPAETPRPPTEKNKGYEDETDRQMNQGKETDADEKVEETEQAEKTDHEEDNRQENNDPQRPITISTSRITLTNENVNDIINQL